MTVNAEKLAAIVQLLSVVRLMVDGGWHFSSPIVRMRAAEPPSETNMDPCGIIIERADALSMVAEVVADLDRTAASLMVLDMQATELEVDTKVMCGADLALLARTYQKLSQDISRAANEAVEALRPTTKPKTERKRRNPTASQVALPNVDEPPTSETETES